MRFHAALLFPVSVLERSGSEVFLEYFAEVSRIAELERCRNTGYLAVGMEQGVRGGLELQFQKILCRSVFKISVPLTEKCAAGHPVAFRDLVHADFIHEMQLEKGRDLPDLFLDGVFVRLRHFPDEKELFQNMKTEQINAVDDTVFL